MKRSRLQRLRELAARRQDYRCYYCGRALWNGRPRRLAPFARTQGLTLRQARLRRCTAEHLQPRSEGGPTSEGNIVAACRFCNRSRHLPKRVLDAGLYRAKVQWLIAQDRWG